jgi:hypothetical protein
VGRRYSRFLHVIVYTPRGPASFPAAGVSCICTRCARASAPSTWCSHFLACHSTRSAGWPMTSVVVPFLLCPKMRSSARVSKSRPSSCLMFGRPKAQATVTAQMAAVLPAPIPRPLAQHVRWAFGVHRSGFTVQRSGFGVQRGMSRRRLTSSLRCRGFNRPAAPCRQPTHGPIRRMGPCACLDTLSFGQV